MRGFNISEINYRRLENFKANKRGYRSFKIFLFLFFFTLFAEFISNDQPIFVKNENSLTGPIPTEIGSLTALNYLGLVIIFCSWFMWKYS